MSRAYSTFAAFWLFYLREHSLPGTRALHYVGTSLVVILALTALMTGTWWLLIAMPAAGYFFAWIAHFRVEKNRPATFTYPLWSLVADFKMWWLWLTRRLGPELERAGVTQGVSRASGPR
ncbi:Mpo1-like protein [Qipengyuania sp. MTN3-11]|uniref:Mpo1-like protein n=1 Tax=Qipengyuania sp. MTN3-11 TaxID=3056557 RepID=UPI0036F2F500